MAGVDVSNKPQMVEHVNKQLPLTVYETKWVPCSARFCVLGSPQRQSRMIQLYNLVRAANARAGCGARAAKGLQVRHVRPLVSRRAPPGHRRLRRRASDLGPGAADNADIPRATGTLDDHQLHRRHRWAQGRWGAGDRHRRARRLRARVDPRQADKPVASMEPEEGAPTRDCWSVSFGDAHSADDRCVVAGYDNGDVKLFDLAAGMATLGDQRVQRRLRSRVRPEGHRDQQAGSHHA